MLYEDLTSHILQACFEVSNELGIGFIESVYEKALLVALREKGLKAENQVPIKVIFRKIIVGDFYADILVENKILIELKAVSSLINSHKVQIINYLKASGIEVGFLVNFGNPKLEYRRFNNQFIENDKINLRDFFAK
jgi:GxxExxY protein